MYHVSGQVKNISIDKSLIHSVRNARSFYEEALKKKKINQDEESKAKTMKREAAVKLRECEAKKRMIMEDARQRVEEIDTEMKQLRK